MCFVAHLQRIKPNHKISLTWKPTVCLCQCSTADHFFCCSPPSDDLNVYRRALNAMNTPNALNAWNWLFLFIRIQEKTPNEESVLHPSAWSILEGKNEHSSRDAHKIRNHAYNWHKLFNENEVSSQSLFLRSSRVCSPWIYHVISYGDGMKRSRGWRKCDFRLT